MRRSFFTYEICKAVSGSAFVCSQNAAQWTPTIETHKKAISKDRHWGNPQALIATKVMDVGVSIEDPEVTTVIVETEDYTVDMIQMIGRIRCADEQRIRLFIHILPDVYYLKKLDGLRDSICMLETHKVNPELQKYNEHAFPSILMDGQVNEMVYRCYKQQAQDAEAVLRFGAEQVISRQLGGLPCKDYRTPVLSAQQTHAQRKQMADELRELIVPLLGKKYDVKTDLYKIFDGLIQIDRWALSLPSARLTRKNINQVLTKLGLPYQIEHKQYSRGSNRGRYYCVLNECVNTKERK